MNSLRFWRTERSLTQLELAKASGVPRWSIQLIEAAHRCPTAQERATLAATLGIAESQLFPEKKEESHDAPSR
jgi:transcriptional regulator with XRE-family HTH domain